MNRLLPSPRRALALVSLGLATIAVSCDDDESRRVPPQGAAITQGVRGRVWFQKVPATSTGLAADEDALLVPARWVRVEVVLEQGGAVAVLARTQTDSEGRYGVGGAFPEGHRVVAYSTSEDRSAWNPGIFARVEDDPLGESGEPRAIYGVISAPQPQVLADGLWTVDLVASARDEDRSAGAFNILDVLQRGAELWLESTGIEPRLVIANWERGVQPRTSFFDPVSNRITVLGGVDGREDFTDTDEFDDSVIAHEYCHFVVWNHAASSSPGGRHAGEDLVPTLAYDEALANWYSSATLGTSRYIDTLGSADGQTVCALCESLESSILQRVSGIGSEQSIMEILWDLTDGAYGSPADTDRDGVAVPVPSLLNAVVATASRADYLHITTLLDELVGAGVVGLGDVQALLSSPEDQDLTYPPTDRETPSTGRDLFPVPIRRGQALEGAVDAFDGGNPARGFHSIRYYGLDVDVPGPVVITLEMDTDGTAPGDLDLYLLTTRNGILGVSEGTTSQERIVAELGTGRWIVAVQAYYVDGTGATVANRGSYTIRVE